MNKNEKILTLVLVSMIAISSLNAYSFGQSSNVSDNEELQSKIKSLESELLNQPTNDELEATIENLQNESQELSKIITDIIDVCNKANADSHKKQNNTLEKENEILQSALAKLRGGI